MNNNHHTHTHKILTVHTSAKTINLSVIYHHDVGDIVPWHIENGTWFPFLPQKERKKRNEPNLFIFLYLEKANN